MMKTRLKEVVNLSMANAEQIQLIFTLYRELFDDKANLCASCPSSVRHAQKNLKQYYETYF